MSTDVTAKNWWDNVEKIAKSFRRVARCLEGCEFISRQACRPDNKDKRTCRKNWVKGSCGTEHGLLIWACGLLLSESELVQILPQVPEDVGSISLRLGAISYPGDTDKSAGGKTPVYNWLMADPLCLQSRSWSLWVGSNPAWTTENPNLPFLFCVPAKIWCGSTDYVGGFENFR